MSTNRQLLLNIFYLISIVGAFTYTYLNQQKLVYIDSVKLLSEYQGMIDARSAYQQKATGWKANIDTLSVEVQDAIKVYQKESIGMTKKEKELSQELIRTKQRQLVDYQQAMQDKAQQEDGQMTSLVVEQVNAYIKQYGEKNGYKIIMAANEYGNIAYAEESLDLTAEVLAGLNKQYNGQ
jgi:outer membrane protein